ncbi:MULTISPECIES: hypothetical protein [unclassified Ruminococcus]|uniref:hypothetical protein n=1 Tax=unclassified Ruminococcus TaxID=2608920 RepID=UPI00210E194B|nr:MULTISPECIES: hypothetical protein [unclassified Ruminococcus]MCQ4022174.1 hypothetical protein [Ruminococcus sp. zg-924]MCQ4115572.1 hypothetical protein [Ruminococcus sp. zg-921]
MLKNEDCTALFPSLAADSGRILQDKCYQTLTKIKAVLEDERLDDKECFIRIEEIVRFFEKEGSAC